MQAIFAFEKRVNNKREEEGKRVVCINCEKEGHTIHTCYKLFPQMRSVEGGEKQDQKGWLQGEEESQGYAFGHLG
jgi:hypothetical protein